MIYGVKKIKLESNTYLKKKFKYSRLSKYHYNYVFEVQQFHLAPLLVSKFMQELKRKAHGDDIG